MVRTETVNKIRNRFVRNIEKFTPFISIYFVALSLLSYVMTGFQTRALLLLAFEIVSQRILALYGLKNESWIIFRCGLKLLSYPVSIKIIHPDFFWVYVNIHLLQIGPNFVDASIYPHVLSLANILYCCYGTYYHLNKSFHHSLSIFFGFFFQHVLVTYFKTLYSANAMNLERKLGEFESIVLSIQSHIIKTDLDLQILLINKDILGHKGDDLRGCSFKNLSIFQKETFDSVIKTKSTESYKIQAFVDQQKYLYMVTVSPILIKGELVGLTILCNDSTHELKLKEKEIQHEKQKFALKSKTEFIASISHEVRNPLQALTFSIENLLSNEPRKDQIGILNEAQSSNQLINHIIGDILDSSKIESGNFQLQNKNFEILESIESALKINIPQAFKKSLGFSYSIDFQIPRIIKGDSQRLIQIISNLMSNAIKYTDTGMIHFQVKKVKKSFQHWIHFSVKDTGIGIKKENLGKIFTMFEQVRESGRSNSWGIGLSIVKGLIELMNGKYGVESEFGNGSTFWFEIPYDTTKGVHSLYNSLPLSHFKTVILMTKEEKIAQQMKTLLYGMNVQNMCFPKSKREIYDTYQYFSDCKIFVDDDLLEYLPSKIPPDQVVVIGNSSKKNNEYNDCLRLFKPLLPSHLIIELTPTLKKKFSGEIKLLDGATVLIVEDHVVIQKCIKKIIEKMGPKRVIVASDGEEALKSFHLENNIDIIISDLNMPKMDGFKLIQSIKSEDKAKDIKIILCTGELNNSRLSSFVSEFKIDDVLLKPVSYKSLMNSLRNSLLKSSHE